MTCLHANAGKPMSKHSATTCWMPSRPEQPYRKCSSKSRGVMPFPWERCQEDNVFWSHLSTET
ncbi:hypothetical protein BU26DRAFT_36433 [Trematosphaeria pertusa]|uniref:Uncharacterized protein n=1 Tax=Trematosphaeria pertusa TaxID=390896 RepID=A0A6A6J6K7_9PLEO|nr:uncharacterized protein BU26DRAFT_36433 [Trematosphaeria pertusa]KAF2257123.1 hypothetical protein BU26DRAFT_36433 [Trematosphaeria pertusa]